MYTASKWPDYSHKLGHNRFDQAQLPFPSQPAIAPLIVADLINMKDRTREDHSNKILLSNLTIYRKWSLHVVISFHIHVRT